MDSKDEEVRGKKRGGNVDFVLRLCFFVVVVFVRLDTVCVLLCWGPQVMYDFFHVSSFVI